VLAALAVVPAAADPIPGATYNGVAADGAGITFTVSSDGTLVDSYQVLGAHGASCDLQAAGASGVWPGAPITNNAFDYEGLYTTGFVFTGKFQGAQKASGTMRLYQPGCDSGTVSWTATTTASPGQGAGGSGGSGGGTGSSGGGGGTSGGSVGSVSGHAFATHVLFRRLSRKILGGRLSSSRSGCEAARTVILWQGSHRLARTKSKANGRFSFRRSARVRGRAVRASVLSMRLKTAICEAGSSPFVKG
jgi:hypothetical protein